MKLTPTALQWNKFSIIGHSMGECGFVADKERISDPSFVVIPQLSFYFISGGSIAGLVSVSVMACCFI